MRLANGTVWPIPVTLSPSDEITAKINVGQKIALVDDKNRLLGVMSVTWMLVIAAVAVAITVILYTVRWKLPQRLVATTVLWAEVTARRRGVAAPGGRC